MAKPGAEFWIQTSYTKNPYHDLVFFNLHISLIGIDTLKTTVIFPFSYTLKFGYP